MHKFTRYWFVLFWKMIYRILSEIKIPVSQTISPFPRECTRKLHEFSRSETKKTKIVKENRWQWWWWLTTRMESGKVTPAYLWICCSITFSRADRSVRVYYNMWKWRSGVYLQNVCERFFFWFYMMCVCLKILKKKTQYTGCLKCGVGVPDLLLLWRR